MREVKAQCDVCNERTADIRTLHSGAFRYQVFGCRVSHDGELTLMTGERLR